MSAITPQFLTDLESRMQFLANEEYSSLLGNLWWRRVAIERPSQAKRDRFTWLLNTAAIQYVNREGGEYEFETLLSATTEFENRTAEKGLELPKRKFDDHDDNGVELATHWARDMGAQAAYWPQKQVAAAIRNGESATAYDGKSFFATDHPVDPFDASKGTYANIFTSSASGAYPGALPIGTDVETAFANLAKAEAYIRGIKMPNGEDPRGLRARAIIVPPALKERAMQLLKADFIAQAALGGSAAATGDVRAVVQSRDVRELIVADELGAGIGGSDTDWYILAEQPGAAKLGPLLYLNREPFSIQFHGPMTSAELARRNKLQWTIHGRNVVGYGHPFLLFKCKAT